MFLRWAARSRWRFPNTRLQYEAIDARERIYRRVAVASFSLIVIGVSAGGLNALGTLSAPTGSRTFPIPIAIVQHRARDSDALALVLQEYTPLRLYEIEDKMAFEPGHVYVAPPDYHTLIDDDHFALSVDAPVMFSRPSIDVLFESAADALGERLVGIVHDRRESGWRTRIAAIGSSAAVWPLFRIPLPPKSRSCHERHFSTCPTHRLLALADIGATT